MKTINLKKYFIILCVGVCLFFSFTHKYYFSIAEMSFNEKEKSYQIILTLTEHDILEALSFSNEERIKIEDKNFEEKLKAYIEEHFSVFGEKEKLKFVWVGYEAKPLQIICYFEYPQTSLIQEIRNTVLIRLFEKQRNIVNIEINKKKQTLIFSNDNIKLKVKKM